MEEALAISRRECSGFWDLVGGGECDEGSRRSLSFSRGAGDGLLRGVQLAFEFFVDLA